MTTLVGLNFAPTESWSRRSGAKNPDLGRAPNSGHGGLGIECDDELVRFDLLRRNREN